MKTFKTGSAVRLIQPVVAGVVVAGKLSESGDAIDYKVVFTLPNGEHHVREFPAEQLEQLEGDAEAAVLEQHGKHVEAQRKNVIADAEHSLRHLEEAKAPQDQIDAARERLEKVSKETA